MASTKVIKVSLLGAFTLFLAIWLASGAYSKIFNSGGGSNVEALTVLPDDDKDKDKFVGSETCQACHEDQFKQFSNTKHAKLANLEGWKDK
ncbi:MAG TPA: multiheme c-type cytochrome, partial [Pyrinomonadaceae bacterium]